LTAGQCFQYLVSTLESEDCLHSQHPPPHSYVALPSSWPDPARRERSGV
jgi:hypothetical protein